MPVERSRVMECELAAVEHGECWMMMAAGCCEMPIAANGWLMDLIDADGC